MSSLSNAPLEGEECPEVMRFTSRIPIAAAFALLLTIVGCSGSFTAPSALGATIAGTVNPEASRFTAFSTAFSSPGSSAATVPTGWTVTVVGTNLTATVDASGNFQITGAPSGDIQLLFSNGVTSGTITLSSVADGELIRLTLIINGGAVTVVDEERSSGKVDLCHRTDRGSYVMISVSVNAESAHRAHGDGAVDERVPGDPTKVFNSACVPVPFGVSIEKSTNGQDADEAPGPSLTVGSAVTWRYVVTNTSTVSLTNVTVTDDHSVVVSCPKATLAIGESMTCTGSGVAVAGQYRNVGKVTANSSLGQFTHSDPSHYFGVPPPTIPPPGQQITICHIPPGNFSARHTITIDASAWPAHQGHCSQGVCDFIGACQ